MSEVFMNPNLVRRITTPVIVPRLDFSQFEQMSEILAQVGRDFDRQHRHAQEQMAAVSKALQPTIEQINSVKEILRVSFKVQTFNLNLVLPPAQRHREIIQVETEETSPILTLASPIAYCPETMSVRIYGTEISLSNSDRLILDAVFSSPTYDKKLVRRSMIEVSVYDEDVQAKSCLNQAVKRLNEKIRKAGYENLFSISGLFILIRY
jgi:DNA-binding response OmpR family regulator